MKRFDRDAVLDRAAELFWRDGYEATSIQAIEATTGLGRGSLYNTFGDKRALFLAVLERYGETFGAAPFRHLDDADVGRGLRAMLDAVVARMDEPGRPRGCLFTNTCLGGNGSPEMGDRIAGIVSAIHAALEAAFVRARIAGQLPDETDTAGLARFYGAVLQGIGVLHSATGNRAMLDDVVAVAMRAWPGYDSAAGVTATRIGDHRELEGNAAGTPAPVPLTRAADRPPKLAR